LTKGRLLAMRAQSLHRGQVGLRMSPAVAGDAPEPSANGEPREAAGHIACRHHGNVSVPWTLRALFHAYRWRILLTYALFNLENLLRLAQPLVLGLAINGLLKFSYGGLLLLIIQHLSHLLLSSGRRMYDTRAFTSIYTDLATRLVLEQRGREVDVSRVTARSALSREYVAFFERDVPVVFGSLYSLVGALGMLCLYDVLVAPLCLVLLIPAFLLNRAYGRKTLLFNGHLNDQWEREVTVISRGQAAEVRGHYSALAHWHVRLSDWEALNFGVMEFFVLGLMAVSLVRFCAAPDASVGDIFAVFRYVLMFIAGLDSLPMLVYQLGRLRDISRRMQRETTDE
jgi:ABC-type multidrug transport system fused ATPase/permease subunit